MQTEMRLEISDIIVSSTIEIQVASLGWCESWSQSVDLPNAGRSLRCMRLCTRQSAEPSTSSVVDGTVHPPFPERSDNSDPLPFREGGRGNLMEYPYAPFVPLMFHKVAVQLPGIPWVITLLTVYLTCFFANYWQLHPTNLRCRES